MNVPQQLFEIRGNQSGSRVFFTNDGFFYHLNRTMPNGSAYYRCTEWRDGCPSTARTTVNGIFSVLGHHSHGGDIRRVDYQIARFDLIDQFRDLNVSSIEDIFSNPRNFPLQQQFPHLTQRQLYPSMLRAREGVLPRIQTLSELDRVLQDPRLTTIHGSREDVLYRGSVLHEDGSSIIIMLSQRCQEFLEIIPCVFVVSTEIRAHTQQYQIIELVWLLAESNVSSNFLVRAFGFVKSCLRSCRINKVICGSRIIGEAFSSSFSVSVSHSLYDYIQWVKDSSLNIDTPAFKTILKLSSALPMLPRDLIQGGIDQIIEEARQTGILGDCLSMFNRIEIEWLSLPEFSVFSSHERTNFGIEDHRHKLKRKFSHITDLFGIVRKIIMRGQKSHQKIQSAIEGQKLPPKLPISLSCDTEVINIVNNSLSVELKIWNLLNIVSRKLPQVN